MSDSNPHRLIFTLFNEIGIIQQLSTARFSRVLAPDLNPSEFGVLNHFVRLGDGKTPTYLAKAFQMTKPSMTAILRAPCRANSLSTSRTISIRLLPSRLVVPQ